MTLHLKYVKTGFSDFFGDDIPTFLLGFHIFLIRGILADSSSYCGRDIDNWFVQFFLDLRYRQFFKSHLMYLKDYHRKECIILIDEYDHPLDIAYRRVQVSDYYRVKSRKTEEKMRSSRIFGIPKDPRLKKITDDILKKMVYTIFF
ncbi:hypothetical protein RhiirA1_390268 [Rhizophagus irregularis]|uniref:AAA-ATPase-like domain-containing protein n=1 Tax=Rhizophagus irregularis TaxID=588596 RepID=A0A2N0S8D0_9GLOM|nr:hypothetical protein RhiirA1_390268 [Rhizophagus irregularis]